MAPNLMTFLTSIPKDLLFKKYIYNNKVIIMGPQLDKSWDDFIYNLDQMDFQGLVGKGSYGEVRKFLYKKNGQMVVSKRRMFNDQKEDH